MHIKRLEHVVNGSLLSSKFSMRVVPSDSATRRRMRLGRDLDPGRVMVPSMLLIGVTVV